MQFLAHQTFPQGFTSGGATKPPTIKFWLGDVFKGRTAYIETLNYVTDQNYPWEIGLNRDDLECYKLPRVIDVSITLHLIDEKSDVETGKAMYDFNWNGAPSKRSTNPAITGVKPTQASLPTPPQTSMPKKGIVS